MTDSSSERTAQRHLDLAIQQLAGGKPGSAATSARAALEASPGLPEALEALGVALASDGQFEEACQILREYLTLQPDSLRARLWLSTACAGAGLSDIAAHELQVAETVAAGKPMALSQVAEAYLQLGEIDRAATVLATISALDPTNPQVAFKVARTFHLAGRADQALDAYRQVLKLQRGVAPAHANIGAIEAEAGNYDEARKQFAFAISYSGDQSVGYRFRQAGLSPVIYESNEQIDAVRARMESEFVGLRRSGLRLTDPVAEVGATNPALAYQGRSNRDLRETIAAAFLAACPDLQWEAPPRTRVSDGRIRLGICSAFLSGHTIGDVMVGLFQQIDRTKFEIYLFRTEVANDAVGRAFDASADRVSLLRGRLQDARATIAAAELDLLFYPDFGADPLTTFLSYARLAPVQIVGWGFPDTSGVPNLDYYLSTAMFEPHDGDDHYSETLVRLPRLYSHLDPARIQADPCSKQELQIEPDRRLYLCGQTLTKVHPDLDSALLALLEADDKAVIAFFATHETRWGELLRERFDRTLGHKAGRVRLLPRLSPAKFQGALRAADAVIDTKHFTGGFTSFLSFGNGIPVVTWDGPLMRGRMTAGLYRTMGLDPLVAGSDEEFASLALRLATDAKWRADWRRAIGERAPRLFEDVESVRAFERFLTAAHLSAAQGSPVEDENFHL